MGTSRHSDNPNLKYLKKMITDSIGEDLWNGLCDMATAERPRVDIYDNGNSLTVLAEIPGLLTPDDVSISVSSKKLNIKGISRDKYQSVKQGRKFRSECLFGSFDRLIELPFSVEEHNINAVYESGILEITIPKADQNSEKAVKIQFRK